MLGAKLNSTVHINCEDKIRFRIPPERRRPRNPRCGGGGCGGGGGAVEESKASEKM